MPLNTYNLGFTISDLPEFCGPDELSDCIIKLRASMVQKHGGARSSPLSDDGIHWLIKLAYYTSLIAEEGRYPRFRLMSTKHGPDSPWIAASFETPINDVDSLRRLAPAVSETDCALLVTERDGNLICTGSIMVSERGFATKIGRPEIASVGQSPSLIIRVDGPGHLRASEIPYTLVLDRAQIRQVVDYFNVDQVRELWKELAEHMVGETTTFLGEESRKYFGGPWGLEQLIHKAWSRVLATTVDRNHGGAFVVLPTEGTPEDFSIHCKHPAQMNFGDDIIQFWQSCIHYANAKDGSEGAAHAWNWRRAALFDKAVILAGLSSVDGCVVLNRKLQVLGFVGEIRVTNKQADEAVRPYKNLATNETEPDEEVLKRLGTRHRSAFRLAKVYPRTIVFVISQDGDLRIFCSDESYVYGFDRLHAWVHHRESQ